MIIFYSPDPSAKDVDNLRSAVETADPAGVMAGADPSLGDGVAVRAHQLAHTMTSASYEGDSIRTFADSWFTNTGG